MAGNIQGIHSVTSDASINNGETLGSDETFYVIQKVTPCGKLLRKLTEMARNTPLSLKEQRSD